MFTYTVINILIEIYYLYNIRSYNNIFVTNNEYSTVINT